LAPAGALFAQLSNTDRLPPETDPLDALILPVIRGQCAAIDRHPVTEYMSE